MLSISDVLLAGRGVITGPGVISAAVLVCQDVCLVGCTLRSGGSLPTEAPMATAAAGVVAMGKTLCGQQLCYLYRLIFLVTPLFFSPTFPLA